MISCCKIKSTLEKVWFAVAIVIFTMYLLIRDVFCVYTKYLQGDMYILSIRFNFGPPEGLQNPNLQVLQSVGHLEHHPANSKIRWNGIFLHEK